MLILCFAISDPDKNTILALFRRQRKLFYNISYQTLGSSQDAEDALQEAFLRITKNIDRINKVPCHEMVPFCVVIVRNCCMTLLRRKEKAVSTDPEALPDGMETETEPSFFRSEDAAVLAERMEQLSPDDRQILRLRYFEDFAYREIGRLLGIDEAAARKREQRALARLRKLYQEEGIL